MKPIRFYLAMGVGKLARTTQRILGMNASFFPGKLAVKICPDFLSHVGTPEKLICVTGTNGKTTVSNLLVDLLAAEGIDTINNHTGSNTVGGVATALLAGARFSGKCKKEWGVLEIDERSSMHIYPRIKPGYVLCTNLFRDSILRNGSPEYIAGIVSDNMYEKTKLILNADDLISGSVAPSNERVYYGIKQMATDTKECRNIVNDCQICPKCATKLEYEYVRYHQIGKAYCPGCGFKSPKPDYEAEVHADEGFMYITAKGETEKYKLVNNSIFNIYNQLAVTSLLKEMGLSSDAIRDGFSRLHIPDFRYTKFEAGGMTVVDMMAKEHNPIACSVVFDYVSHEPGVKEILFLLDDETPRESMCWIYDCDYEKLNSPLIRHIVIPGTRSLDQKLRLLIAGVPEEKISIGMEDTKAPSYLNFDGADSVFVLHQHWKPEMDKKVVGIIREMLEERGKKNE